MRRTLLALAAAAIAMPLAAQTPDAVREKQLAQLRHQRTTILAMADSMPESLYADKATPIQRSFAAQLTHAAGAVAGIMGQFHAGVAVTLPDTAMAHASRANLRAYVNAAYDAAERMLGAETAAERTAEISLFGNPMPLWQAWDEIHMHTAWTTGQVVANFRKHGMAPPAFSFF